MGFPPAFWNEHTEPLPWATPARSRKQLSSPPEEPCRTDTFGTQRQDLKHGAGNVTEGIEREHDADAARARSHRDVTLCREGLPRCPAADVGYASRKLHEPLLDPSHMDEPQAEAALPSRIDDAVAAGHADHDAPPGPPEARARRRHRPRTANHLAGREGLVAARIMEEVLQASVWVESLRPWSMVEPSPLPGDANCPN